MCSPITLPLRTRLRHAIGVEDTRVQRLARVFALLLLFAPSMVWAVDAGGEAVPPSAGAQHYMTKPGDTLWDIARRLIRDDGISPQQMMLALRDTNPGAFAAGNINNLKPGYRLRIPPRETILAISAAEAAAEVARQNASWRESGARPTAPTPDAAEEAATASPSVTAAQPTAPPASETEDTSAATTLAPQPVPAPEAPPVPVAPEAVSEDTGARAGAEGQETAPRQHDQLLAQEPTHRRDADNEALQARIAALEDKLAALDGIIATQHEQLTELRQRRAAETLVREREPQPTPRGGEGTVVRPPSASRNTWPADPTLVILLSAAAVLGLAVIWLLRRRTTANRTALDTASGVAEQTVAARPDAEADNALAIGLDDLHLGPQAGTAAGHPGARAEPIGLEPAAGEAEDRVAALSIGLDDLELEFEPPGDDQRR
jgi:FimV-like protein